MELCDGEIKWRLMMVICDGDLDLEAVRIFSWTCPGTGGPADNFAGLSPKV